MDDGKLVQRAEQLIGSAVAQAIIGMVLTGELDTSLGIQILKRVEAGIQELKDRLLQEELEQLLNHQQRRQATA